ncbi:MAG: hypothetical protein KKH45_10135 [Proteobacteria bacterium]|nr:hypothetical protein [Pseudomonadota bacterium]
MRISSNKISIPVLQSGEEVILQGKGAYKDTFRSGWKIADCFLTNQRIMINQGSRVRLGISIKDITQLRVEKLHYVIKKKETLSLFYKSGKDSKEYRIWLVTQDLENWKKRIYQLTLLKIDADLIEKIAVQLDSEGRDILWFLWENHHARIDRLAELINAPNHMHVLVNIKETINPIAEKVAGCPILSFERAKIDPETGEKVLFSWWLLGELEEWENKNERLLDIFDEGSYIQVIMEVKKVEKSDLSLEINNAELVVKSNKIGHTWTEAFNLPVESNYENHEIYLRNNLLEIRLSKVQWLVDSEQ